MSNSRINEYRIRQRIHQVVYDALGIPSRIPPEPEKERRLLRPEPQVPEIVYSSYKEPGISD